MTIIRSFAAQLTAATGALCLSLALMGATVATPATPSAEPAVAMETLA